MLCAPLFGITLYWTGGTSTDWSTASNWGLISGGSNGSVPASTDSLVFDVGSVKNCSLTVTNASVSGMRFLSTCTQGFKQNSRKLNVNNFISLLFKFVIFF